MECEGILPRNERFEITTIWDSMKDQEVSFGDQGNQYQRNLDGNCPMSQIAIERNNERYSEIQGYIIIKGQSGEKK